MPYPTPEVRFWSKVDKTDTCWIWTAGTNSGGYGCFGLNRRMWQAHRVAWTWARGPIPQGMVIDHICHNRLCVNVDHLRLATLKQNGEYRRGANRNNRSSGIRGVRRDGLAWRATIKHHGKDIHLGNYSTIEEAAEAARKARAEMFTFPDPELRVADSG